MLIDTEEEDGVDLFIIDEEEEGMISFELRVEQRSGRSEAE